MCSPSLSAASTPTSRPARRRAALTVPPEIRREAARLAATRVVIGTTSTRCARGYCGDLLVAVQDSLGRVALACPRCGRRARGVCRDCPRPVAGTVGKAVRCAACAQRALREAVAQSHARAARSATVDPATGRRCRPVEERRIALPTRVRATPTCAVCTRPIDYDGNGRPPKRHPACANAQRRAAPSA